MAEPSEEEGNNEGHIGLLPSLPAGAVPGAEDADSFVTITTACPSIPTLSRPLCALYMLNGLTLALPVTALLYIVNTRAAISVTYLSAYGAVAFLPFSLKPFYAFLSSFIPLSQQHLLLILLFFSAIACAATVLIPHDGVLQCFLAALARGVTSAWAEFLLGLSLIRQARQTCNYDAAASKYQSQAATARNLGSWMANLMAFWILAARGRHDASSSQQNETENELSDTVVSAMLLATAALNLFGSAIACCFEVDREQMGTAAGIRKANNNRDHDAMGGVVGSYELLFDDAESMERHMSDGLSCPTIVSESSLSSSFGRHDLQFILLFQLAIILVAMRGPIVSISSMSLWCLVLLVLAISLLLLSCRMQLQWNRMHRVGLFLLLRHAIPKNNYLMESYTYDLFKSTPMLLQLLSVVSTGAIALASWSYGRVLSRHSHGWRLQAVLVGTTVGGSLLSLANLTLINLTTTTSGVTTSSVVIAMAVTIATTFASEWQFLPDVILATAAVGNSEAVVLDAADVVEHGTNGSGHPKHDRSPVRQDPTAIRYGMLISCIDFGGQIGSWGTVPLVAGLGISRENDWRNLDTAVFVMSLLGVASAMLIAIVRNIERRD